MSLFRRKDVAALQAELATDHSLKRTLGAGGLVMLASVIGLYVVSAYAGTPTYLLDDLAALDIDETTQR